LANPHRIAIVLFFLALVFMLFSGISCVTALDNRINITITEYVDKNVSYGKDFVYSDNVEYYFITGFINVTNPSNEAVYDIFITFLNTNDLLGNVTYLGGRNGTHYNGTAGEYITLHIPQLRPDDSTLFNYTMNSTSISEPLNMETEYNLGANNYYWRKVLAGENLTIRQNITNELDIVMSITNINITMLTQGIWWNNSVLHNFTFEKLITSGDWANVTNGTNRTWNWVPSGGTLGPLDAVNITYVIQAPNMVPSSQTYLMLIEQLQYEVPYVASNLTLFSVHASSKSNFSFEKRIARPSNNNNDHNVTWEIVPHINTPYDVAYNLTKVSFWVTSDLNPNNLTTDSVNPSRTLNYTYLPYAEVNSTQAWDPANYWYFNYTDGSGGYPPPIVWMRPEYHLINDGRGQITNQSYTYNGTDMYMKYVYVVAGYWLQVEKNVTSVADDQYRIYIDVKNIGNGATPQNLTVTVYDVIPNGFYNSSAMIPVPSANQPIVGAFNGTAYQWDIPPKGELNSSLYARGDLNNYDKWNATYLVNGTGDYRVTDLYIIGLDPRLVDGAFGSPLIAVMSGFQTYSKEIMYFSIVLFLIILNTTNLLISTRINRKIDKHDMDGGMSKLEADVRELKDRITKRRKK